MTAFVLCSLDQPHLNYHSHPEPIELRWVAASTGQGSILEAVIHGRESGIQLGDIMPYSERWVSQNLQNFDSDYIPSKIIKQAYYYRLFFININLPTQGYSMKKFTKCQLCGSQEPLQDSHIIPHFLYKYMNRHLKSEFDGDKPIQFDSKLNLIQRSDRQWKEKMFCWNCEQLLSKNETLFSQIFQDIVSCHPSDRIKFAYRYGMELEQLDQEFGCSKKDIELLLDNSYFDMKKADIVRSFAISYVIRCIYLSDVKVSENLLKHIEGILYGLPLDSVKVIMSINTGNNFKIISSVYPLDSDPK